MAVVISSGLSVKSWAANLPTVETVRPVACPRCGHGARANGLSIYGHGIASRLVLSGGPGGRIELSLRRYRCMSCGATCTVGPADLVRGRHFLRGTIATAIALWALTGQTAAAVRAQLSPDTVRSHDAERDWPMLRRWVAAAKRVFGELCPVRSPAESPMTAAARIARWILAHAPPDTAGLTIGERAALAVCSPGF